MAKNPSCSCCLSPCVCVCVCVSLSLSLSVSVSLSEAEMAISGASVSKRPNSGPIIGVVVKLGKKEFDCKRKSFVFCLFLFVLDLIPKSTTLFGKVKETAKQSKAKKQTNKQGSSSSSS